MNKREIKADLLKNKPQCVWMENASGTMVYIKNAVNSPIGPHIDAMFRAFDSLGMPDGTYYVCAKNKHGSREGASFQYEITKGQQRPALSEGPNIQDRNTGMPMQHNAPAFSPMEFIQLNADLAAAKAENTIYKQQINRLESELIAAQERCEELQDKLDDRDPQDKNEKGFAEQANTFLSAAAPFAPLLAAFFAKSNPVPAMPAMPVIPMMPEAPTMQEQQQQQQQQQPTNEKTTNRYDQSDFDDLGRIKMLFQRNPEAFDQFVAENYELGAGIEEDPGQYEYAGFNDNGAELNEE